MLEVINGLIFTLNLIEVHGEKNLCLLYNAIDTLKQLRDGFSKNKAENEKKEAANVENPT